MKKPTYLIFAIILFAFSVNVFAQAVTFESAKANYDAKEYKKAINGLSQLVDQESTSNKAEVLNYLGLSFRALGENKKAKDALKKASKIDPKNINIRFNYAVVLSEVGDSDARSQIDQILEADPEHIGALYMRAAYFLADNKIDKADQVAGRMIELAPKSIDGYIIRSKALEREMNIRIITNVSTAKKEIEFLQRSERSLRSGLEKCGNCPDRPAFEEQLENTWKFLQYLERSDEDKAVDQPKKPEKDSSPLKVLRKRSVRYTGEARQRGVEGKVILMALFGSSGKVEKLIVLKALGFGLDAEAMDAASTIEFEPERKNGKPISSMKVIEYMFTMGR